MKENELRNGDIVRVDYIEYYTNEHPKPYDAVLLWKGINYQPLMVKLDELEKGEYRPFWSVYEHISEVKGHINLAEILTDKGKEFQKEQLEEDDRDR